MLLPKFDYHEPTSLEAACQIMAQLGKDAKVLAGGTDLLVNMKRRLLSPDHLVSLGRVPELYALERENGEIRIGACVTAAELAESEAIGKTLNALASSAGGLGSPLIRNLASIAGNLVSARPAADLPPPLMAYGAKALVKSATHERTVLLEDFFTGPGETVMGADEILTAVHIPQPPDHTGAGYIKLGVRKTLEISLVNVAACLSLDGEKGAIQEARIVLGAVAPTPIRAPSAEKALMGEMPSEALFEKAGEAAAEDSRPIDDFRGSAAYRRDMVAALTRRTLAMALQGAQGIS